MNVYIMTRTYNGGGGGKVYYLAAAYLENALGDYGPGLGSLEIYVFFRNGSVADANDQGMYDEYHSELLPTRPYLKFLRKKRRFDLSYETNVADANLLLKDTLSVRLFRHVLDEMAAKFHLLDSRIKKTDGFDLETFHKDVAKHITHAPKTNAELQSLKLELDAKDEARRAALSEWDRLAVDWDDFHPTARQILTVPFFWDVMDEYAPHGNDSGSDILSHFLEWNRKNSNVPACNMAPKLLSRWGVPSIDYEIVDAATVERLLQRDTSSIADTDDVLIAIAFASIKVRGCCDRETRKLGLAAIQREQLQAVIAQRAWPFPEDRLQSLQILREALVDAPLISKTTRSKGRTK